MTREERTVMSIRKEIEKYEARLERLSKTLEKKRAKCEKLNCMWTDEEMRQNRDNGTMTDKQWSAWFDFACSERDVNDTIKSIDKYNRRLAEHTAIVESETESRINKETTDNRISGIESEWSNMFKNTVEKYEEWLRKFKAECLKDGIVIDSASANYIDGITKNGKKFVLYINNGLTDRSWHCYTLCLNGDTIFTSGTFNTAYRYMMR